MTDLLRLVVTERAEGLSVNPGRAPAVHLRGEVHVIEGPSVSPENAESMLRSLVDTRRMREFRQLGRTEFVFTFGESARFRVEATSEHDAVQFRLERIDNENAS